MLVLLATLFLNSLAPRLEWSLPFATPTLRQAVPHHHGITGRVGGWLYTPSGSPICHGWDAYARQLRYLDIIKAKTVTDPRTGNPVERWAINWRKAR